MARRLRFWLATIMVGYLALGFIVALIEPWLLFHPTKKPMAACDLPDSVEQVMIGNERGLFTATGGKALLVFYHGNAEDACNWRFLGVNHASAFGFDTLVMEYPGYAVDPRDISPSAASIKGMVETVQVWAKSRYRHVVAMGFSLGTGAASHHAKLGGTDQIVLFASYQSLFELAQNKGYPFPKFWFRNNLDSASALIEARTPVHIVFGERDIVVPPSRSTRLVERLQAAGVEVTSRPVAKAGHGGLFGSDVLDEALRIASDAMATEEK